MKPQTTTPPPTGPYDRDAIFHDDGPFSPLFVNEAVRTLIRTLPLDPTEPKGWSSRRMHCALTALAALHPRDEIEIMLGVQALAAYHAAAACFRIGMNHHRPNGDSTRHIATAISAARAFDSLIKAIERRQAKPLSVPVGRPAPQIWPETDPEILVGGMEGRCRDNNRQPTPAPEPQAVWTPEDLNAADAFIAKRRIEKENEGLDIANTEGILPGGGMILPEDPTPHQKAYMGRRLGLMYRREYEDNLRKGITTMPKIRPIRTGDRIP